MLAVEKCLRFPVAAATRNIVSHERAEVIGEERREKPLYGGKNLTYGLNLCGPRSIVSERVAMNLHLLRMAPDELLPVLKDVVELLEGSCLRVEHRIALGGVVAPAAGVDGSVIVELRNEGGVNTLEVVESLP